MRLERKPHKQGQLWAHHRASSSCLHGAHSSWPLPLSTIPYLEWYTGPFMGRKLGRCKTQVPKVCMLFHHQCCQQRHLVAWLAPCSALTGGPDSGPGQHSAELLWVWQGSLSKQLPKSFLTTNPFILKGESDKNQFFSKHTFHNLHTPFLAPSKAGAHSQDTHTEAGQFSIKFS